MTNVLVAYATKMGATREIAEAIARRLRAAGIDVSVREAAAVENLEGMDAAVIGSALYASRWRPEAVALLSRIAQRDTAAPTWLFQSGPCNHDTDLTAVPVPKKIQQLAARLGAAPPVTFGGRIESDTAVGFLARRMAKGPLGGDYRDFTEIARWADEVAQRITETATPTTTLAH